MRNRLLGVDKVRLTSGVLAAACLLAASCLWAAPAVKCNAKSGKSYKAYDPIVLTATDLPADGKTKCLWDVDAPAKVVEAGGTLYVWAPPQAVPYKVTLTTFGLKNGDIDVQRTRFEFTVEGATPPVPPPVPPGPNPPVPPVPPDDAPIKAEGFRVLIVFDGKDTKMPEAQQEILYGVEFRDFLRASCVAGDDKKTPEARIFPATTDVSGQSQLWRDAMARQRKTLPWMVVSNGKTGYEGPLPADVPAALALCKKYLPK